VPPTLVDDMTPAQIITALEGHEEDERHQFILAAFPVWLESGKKGESFPTFVSKLGLGDKKNPPHSRGGRMTKAQLNELYGKAAAIKRTYLETRK